LERSEDLAVVPLELAAGITQFTGVANYADISAFYGLPVLSFRDAVYTHYCAVVNHTDPTEFPVTRDIWGDGRHMRDWGHTVVLDLLVFLIQTELQEEEAVAPDRSPDLWEPKERTEFGDKTKPIEGNTVTAPLAALKVHWPSAYMSSAQGVCNTLTETSADENDPLEH
jgi:hypothetical protein